MRFGQALDLLVSGHRVTRQGWNGANMYVSLVDTSKLLVVYGEVEAPHENYFVIKTTRDTYATWVPSISDILANDWVVLED